MGDVLELEASRRDDIEAGKNKTSKPVVPSRYIPETAVENQNISYSWEMKNKPTSDCPWKLQKVNNLKLVSETQ